MDKRIEIIAAITGTQVRVDGQVVPGVQRVTWDIEEDEVTMVVRRTLSAVGGVAVLDVINA